jgi:hypothetical protein
MYRICCIYTFTFKYSNFPLYCLSKKPAAPLLFAAHRRNLLFAPLLFLISFSVYRLEIQSMLGICDILVRIRIQLRIRLLSLSILRMQKIFVTYISCQQAHHLQSKKFNFLLKFCVKMLFFKHYFSPLGMRNRSSD